MLFIDQMNRNVYLKQFPPQKIISLVPSITELLVELGLENQLAGITKFCVHPDKIFRIKEKIGGTKKLNIEKIKQIHPDLIIGNKEENVKEQIEELEKYFPVWMSDVCSYEDAMLMIEKIGEITNTSTTAKNLIDQIENEFKKLQKVHHILKNKSVLYLIWYRPFIAVGNNTYINSILNKIGAINVAQEKERYFEINIDELQSIQPDYLLLSSEPFPFSEKHKTELSQYISSKTRIFLVNGEVFSWYGARMKYLPEYLLSLKES